VAFFLFIALGLALLLLTYLVARRKDPRAEGGAVALLEARQALDSLQTGLLPPEIVGRVFDRRDLDFVTSSAGRQVQDLFLEERQRLALIWIRQLRSNVLSLKGFHSGYSRSYAGLNVRAEIGLAFSFASLLVLCRTLEAVFYLNGPYAASRLVGNAISVAESVCTISERSLAFLASGDGSSVGRGSAGSESAV